MIDTSHIILLLSVIVSAQSKFFSTPLSDECFIFRSRLVLYVPTCSRFRITLRRPGRTRALEQAPPCRPSRGAVEAGGHDGGRSKRKGPPRVEKRAVKRGKHSDFHSFNDTILDLLHVFVLFVYPRQSLYALQSLYHSISKGFVPKTS